MNVGLRQLKVFLAVARHRSFSRAAEDIGSSQSAVSLAIRQVETELGVKLLDRTTRHVRLTTVGETLVATGARLLNELDAVLRELRDVGAQHRGTVAMACVPSIARSLMPRCIEHCKIKWPNVSFAIEDVAAKEVIQKAVRGEIEFGISSGAIAEAELEIHKLMTDPFVLVCRRDDPFAEKRIVTWPQLGDRPLVMLNNTSGSRQQIIDTLTRLQIRAQVALELAQPSSVLGMVEAGLGVAVVPEMVAPYAAHPTLITRQLARPAASRTILMFKRKDRSLSPAAQVVWQSLFELFGSRKSMTKRA
jgi:DNA-binding transcriptional LysR family regulator